MSSVEKGQVQGSSQLLIRRRWSMDALEALVVKGKLAEKGTTKSVQGSKPRPMERKMIGVTSKFERG